MILSVCNQTYKPQKMLLETKILKKIRLELSELSNKIESILNDGHDNEEEYNGKLILLNGKLEELNLADTANANINFKTKVNELEEALTKMLE